MQQNIEKNQVSNRLHKPLSRDDIKKVREVLVVWLLDHPDIDIDTYDVTTKTLEKLLPMLKGMHDSLWKYVTVEQLSTGNKAIRSLYETVRNSFRSPELLKGKVLVANELRLEHEEEGEEEVIETSDEPILKVRKVSEQTQIPKVSDHPRNAPKCQTHIPEKPKVSKQTVANQVQTPKVEKDLKIHPEQLKVLDDLQRLSTLWHEYRLKKRQSKSIWKEWK